MLIVPYFDTDDVDGVCIRALLEMRLAAFASAVSSHLVRGHS